MKFFEKRPLPPAVPIVPMIDILTILLIFFIVHTQWKKPRTLLEIDIPAVRSIQANQEVRQRAILRVAEDGRMELDGEEVSVENLAQSLKSFKHDKPDLNLEMEADRKVPLESLVKVWDALTEAGIDIKEVPARIEVEATGEKP